MTWIPVLMMVACGGDDGGDDTGDTLTDPKADQLLADIDGYASWSQVKDWKGVQESESVHGAAVQIWYNDAAYDTVQAQKGGDMPEGAIIVKESYTDVAGKEVDKLNAMYKDPDSGDWYWAQWSLPDEELLTSGTPAGCIDCHSGGQDSVFTATW